MNYANIYREMTPEEINMILENVDELSYEAKTAMYNYLMEKPAGVEVSEEKMEELRASYHQEDEDIASLKYLSNLGFKVKGTLNEVEIKRAGTSKFVDAVGIIVGILLITTLFSAYESFMYIIESGFEMMKLIGGIINAIIGLFGLMLFVKTLSRLMEFNSFKVKRVGDQLTINLMDDLKKRTYQVDKTAIIIDHEDGGTVLSFVSNDQKYELIRSDAGRVLQNTLAQLGKVLSE